MKVEKVQRKYLADSCSAFLRRRPSRWLIPRQGCSISRASLPADDSCSLLFLQRRLQIGGLDFGADAGIADLSGFNLDGVRRRLTGPQLVEHREGDLAASVDAALGGAGGAERLQFRGREGGHLDVSGRDRAPVTNPKLNRNSFAELDHAGGRGEFERQRGRADD